MQGKTVDRAVIDRPGCDAGSVCIASPDELVSIISSTQRTSSGIEDYAGRDDRNPTSDLSKSAAISWYVWCSVTAVTLITSGFYWDICWHLSIGRDTFWTPPHILLQCGAALACMSCRYLILTTTFSREQTARQNAVRVWGFHGPLGAFVTAWGGFAVMTSAPFDNWWHESFGLDVKILSPPHVLLIFGMTVIGLGALLLLAARLNTVFNPALNGLLLYVGALLLSLVMIQSYELAEPKMMHSSIYYIVLALGIPVVLLGIARVSDVRFAATIIAAIYTGLWLLGLWLLPLFHAQPKLGPVFTNLTHMVPLRFPTLILPSAFMLDLLRRHQVAYSKLVQSVISGGLFVVVDICAQWPFATFLMSPLARNRWFGMHYFNYTVPPENYAFHWTFAAYDKTAHDLALGLMIAVMTGMVSSRIGIACGDCMRRIRR